MITHIWKLHSFMPNETKTNIFENINAQHKTFFLIFFFLEICLKFVLFFWPFLFCFTFYIFSKIAKDLGMKWSESIAISFRTIFGAKNFWDCDKQKRIALNCIGNLKPDHIENVDDDDGFYCVTFFISRFGENRNGLVWIANLSYMAMRTKVMWMSAVQKSNANWSKQTTKMKSKIIV